MDLPHWNASLELGVPEIDRDHQHLIELVRSLQALNREDADREAIWSILVDLEDYTRQHFTREERLMRDIGHEFTADHIAEHEQMVLDVKNTMEDFLQGRVSVGPILAFLEKWLLVHIGGSDTLLANAINRARSGNR